MIYSIFFEDKLAKVSTHGCFTIWSVANDQQAGVEMIGAGITDEIGLQYISEGDCLLEDIDENTFGSIRERLAAFWQTLTPEQHKERAKIFERERKAVSEATTRDDARRDRAQSDLNEFLSQGCDPHEACCMVIYDILHVDADVVAGDYVDSFIDWVFQGDAVERDRWRSMVRTDINGNQETHDFKKEGF